MAAVSQKEKDMIERRNREWDEAQRRKKQASKSLVIGKRPAAIDGELEICERQIEQGRQKVEQGQQQMMHALARIQAGHLYKKAGYSDFDTYCRERWGFSGAYGYQVVEASHVVKSLSEKSQALVDTPRKALAIAAVSVEKRDGVVKRLAKAGEPVTAIAIREEIRPEELKSTGPKKKKKAPLVIDVTPEPPQPKPRIHDCPMCRCEA